MSALAGKTAVVTGSSRGVGASTAKQLAALGANVVVNYRQKAPRANKVVTEIEAAGGRAIAVGADLTDPAACAASCRPPSTPSGASICWSSTPPAVWSPTSAMTMRCA